MKPLWTFWLIEYMNILCKIQKLSTPRGYADAVFLMLSSKLYCPGDWIYAARSCLSRCTLGITSACAASIYHRCFSKGQTTFLLCMLRKELAGRPDKLYQVMVIRRVAPTTNRSTNFRAHHFEFGNSCFYLLWKSALRTWPWPLYVLERPASDIFLRMQESGLWP